MKVHEFVRTGERPYRSDNA